MSIRIITGDCLTVLPQLAAEGVRAHAVVCDPPYHLTSIVKRFGAAGAAPATVGATGAYARASAGFMGQQWDGGDVAFRPETWAAVMACMRPGAHLVAFGGTRTWHRMAVAIEDAGFEIRDSLAWLYGCGFPKSHDVSKGIDATILHGGSNSRSMKRTNEDRPGAGRVTASLPNNGVMSEDRRTHVVRDEPATPEAAAWAGWGTALKPAYEPIIVARKPLVGTVAANVLEFGTGALNIDACRIDSGGTHGSARSAGTGAGRQTANVNGSAYGNGLGGVVAPPHPSGRWPANVIHDGSAEVEAAFAVYGESKPKLGRSGIKGGENACFMSRGDGSNADRIGTWPADTGGTASRFFYSAKADATDRAGSKHPTVKPTDLMRWLVQLTCPPGGLVLDPFAGTGSTGLAADQLGIDAILVERDPTYAADALRKISADGGLFSTAAAE